MGTQTGTDNRGMAAGHGEPPAASVDAGVSADPGLCSERDAKVLLNQFVQSGRHATQALQRQKTIRQKAHSGVVVKTRPRASLEVVQTQLFLELLVALLDVPATLPQLNRVDHRCLSRQVRQRIADRAIASPLHQQPACFGFQVRHIASRPAMLPTVRRPHPHPSELGLQRALGAVTPADGCAFQLLSNSA